MFLNQICEFFTWLYIKLNAVSGYRMLGQRVGDNEGQVFEILRGNSRKDGGPPVFPRSATSRFGLAVRNCHWPPQLTTWLREV